MRRCLLFLIPILLCLSAPSYSAPPGFLVTGTKVLDRNQYPAKIKILNPQFVLLVGGSYPSSAEWARRALRGDTVLNLKLYLDSSGMHSYRLLFAAGRVLDSVWQTDLNFRITDKCWPAGEGLLRVQALNAGGKVTDQFHYNYGAKYRDEGRMVPAPAQLMRLEQVYSRTDRQQYAVGNAWVLSIGIDRYESDIIPPLMTCESDARAYDRFFLDQFLKRTGLDTAAYHSFLLTGKNATKANIISALREIASRAVATDYFIFNFNGMSMAFQADDGGVTHYFFPYDTIRMNRQEFDTVSKNRAKNNERLISLKLLQEHIQLIPAKNQLFITEAGDTKSFKTEFIRTLMQFSPSIASMLDVNRVIIVPDGMGLDGFSCSGERVNKAPTTYSITSLDSNLNIFQLFESTYQAKAVAAKLTDKIRECKAFDTEFFEVFFERPFLKQYRDIFGSGAPTTRGGVGVNKQSAPGPAQKGRRHAFLVGTDRYRGEGWQNLSNPIYDVSEAAALLKDLYGYDTIVLRNAPMDSIYRTLRKYYLTLQKVDQLVVYFAGHGDYDKDLLDDGFIVCTDSKSVEDDPLRNTYIQHTKLKKIINRMPASQILVLLDICHGGVFDEEVRNNPASRTVNRNVQELLQTNEKYTVRKMLSSVGTQPAFDGKAGRHSPFAGYLINVLNARGGAEGIITLSDLYVLLQKASLNEDSNLKIAPHMADFGDSDALGEFILLPKREEANQR